MPNPNRVRGFSFEREVVDMAKHTMLNARRARGSDGRSIGFHESVDGTIESLRFQCKRHKKIPKYLVPTEHYDLLIQREDRGEAIVTLKFDFFLQILSGLWKIKHEDSISQ